MTRVLTAKGEQKDALADFIPVIPRAKVTLASAAAVAAASYLNPILWDGETFDTDTMYDLVTNNSRVTIKTAGVYRITCQLQWGGSADALPRLLDIMVNGTIVASDGRPNHNNAGIAAQQSASVDVELAVGDYVQARAYNGSGNPINLAAGSTWMSVVYIGPGFNAVRAKPTIQYVTPAQFAGLAPIDGDEVYLIVDATNGVIWHLRYNAASASAYKWEFLGGPSLRTEIDTGETCSNPSWVDLATVQSIVMPRAGEYEVEWGAKRIDIPTGNTGPSMGLDYPGHVAAFDAQTLVIVSPTGSASYTTMGKRKITIASASDALKVKYAANAGASNTVSYRYTFVRPVRIS